MEAIIASYDGQRCDIRVGSRSRSRAFIRPHRQIEHVDQSRNGSTWNFDWLFKAQQYKRCKFVRLFTKSLCGISHMCDDFYGSEIDVNGNDDKKKSRIKTDPANIREHEGVSGRERERSHRDFFHMPPHFKKQVPSTLIRGLTGYGCFYSCQ